VAGRQREKRLENYQRGLLVSGSLAAPPFWTVQLTPLPAHSCFNAFSRVDVRVEVKIPGSVEAYVVDLRGEK
jgi:hypothetical protein